YLLLSSLDISRRNLALNGEAIFEKVKRFSRYAREEINEIGDYYAYSKELINGDSVFDFDETKLSVNTLEIGLAGIEVYDILRDRYDIQIEFGDLGNILAYLSVGDKTKNIERLISALSDIRRLDKRPRAGMFEASYISPDVAATPQAAFYANKRSLPLRACVGEISTEFVMSYPPGIPILAPGERVTADIVAYIEYAKAKGCVMTGPEHMDLSKLNVMEV
ncbi:MAG: arginine decarboxylase, partial [Christensenellales bacterium]